MGIYIYIANTRLCPQVINRFKKPSLPWDPHWQGTNNKGLLSSCLLLSTTVLLSFLLLLWQATIYYDPGCDNYYEILLLLHDYDISVSSVVVVVVVADMFIVLRLLPYLLSWLLLSLLLLFLALW